MVEFPPNGNAGRDILEKKEIFERGESYPPLLGTVNEFLPPGVIADK
jgi:hypothetical protein